MWTRPSSYPAISASRATIVDSLMLGMPGDAEQRADATLVHRAVRGQRRILLVQREDAAAQPLVLQRTAQHRGADDGAPVVGEAERADGAQLGHLGQLLARHALR